MANPAGCAGNNRDIHYKTYNLFLTRTVIEAEQPHSSGLLGGLIVY